MSKTQEKLVREEQKILNDLIRDMDATLLQLDKKLTHNQLQAQKAKTSWSSGYIWNVSVSGT